QIAGRAPPAKTLRNRRRRIGRGDSRARRDHGCPTATEQPLPVNFVCQSQRFFVWKERLFHLIHDVGERNTVFAIGKRVASARTRVSESFRCRAEYSSRRVSWIFHQAGL